MTFLSESTPTERAALLTYWLVNGRSLTTSEAAEMLCVSQRTAQRTFIVISRTVPIFREDETGAWRIVGRDEGAVQISPY